MHYKTIVLNSRPLTDIEPDTFRTETHPRSELKPGKGEALVQCTWLSLDPAMRGYIRDTRSYLPPVKIGEVCHILVGEICCAMVADITAGDACCWPWCGCGGWTREQVQRGWSCKRFMGCVSFLFIPYYISLVYMSLRYDWIRCYERQKSGEDCVCTSFACQLESLLQTYPSLSIQCTAWCWTSWFLRDTWIVRYLLFMASILNYLTSNIFFNRSDCLLRTTLFSCNSPSCFWISPVGPRENWPPKTWGNFSCLWCRRLRWFRRLSAWQSHGG